MKKLDLKKLREVAEAVHNADTDEDSLDSVEDFLSEFNTHKLVALLDRLEAAERVCEAAHDYMNAKDWPNRELGIELVEALAAWRGDGV